MYSLAQRHCVPPSSIFIRRKGWRNNALPSGERPVSLYYVLKKSQEANRVVLAELLYESFAEKHRRKKKLVLWIQVPIS